MYMEQGRSIRFCKFQGVTDDILKNLPELGRDDPCAWQIIRFNGSAHTFYLIFQVLLYLFKYVLQAIVLKEFISRNKGKGKQVVDHQLHPFGGVDDFAQVKLSVSIQLFALLIEHTPEGDYFP